VGVGSGDGLRVGVDCSELVAVGDGEDVEVAVSEGVGEGVGEAAAETLTAPLAPTPAKTVLSLSSTTRLQTQSPAVGMVTSTVTTPPADGTSATCVTRDGSPSRLKIKSRDIDWADEVIGGTRMVTVSLSSAVKLGMVTDIEFNPKTNHVEALAARGVDVD
jgi:hypothetical protein